MNALVIDGVRHVRFRMHSGRVIEVRCGGCNGTGHCEEKKTRAKKGESLVAGQMLRDDRMDMFGDQD